MIFHPWAVTLRTPAHTPVDAASALVYLACAIAVGLLTRRRPALGVAALLVLAPFDFARYAGPTTVTTLKAGLVGMFVALAFSRFDLAAFRTVPVRAVLAAFVATLLAVALSALHAQHLGEVLREGLKDGEYLLLLVGALIAFATDPDERPLWLMLEVAVLLVSLSALAEYLTGARSGIMLHGHSAPRIAGALEGPNQLAGYFDVTLPVLVARALGRRDRFLTAVIAIAAVTDVLTISRSGIIGVSLGVILVLLILRPFESIAWRFAAAVVLLLGIGTAGAIWAGVPAGYFSLDPQTSAGDHLANRAQLWRAAIALWQTSPVVGVGAGNYELDLSEVGLVDVRTHANSVYLQSLAEEGVVGVVATLAMFATVIVALARGARRPLIVGVLGATIALAAHQVFDDLFFFPKVASVYWLLVGVALAEVAAQRLSERGGAAATAAKPPSG
ncbi:MAG TPA: O-antigen ligase family protein [Candidatus Elarobacter sp.]|nr:O-antigen ligase family protein [Candidatus Elarobacter sp.]